MRGSGLDGYAEFEANVNINEVQYINSIIGGLPDNLSIQIRGVLKKVNTLEPDDGYFYYLYITYKIGMRDLIKEIKEVIIEKQTSVSSHDWTQCDDTDLCEALKKLIDFEYNHPLYYTDYLAQNCKTNSLGKKQIKLVVDETKNDEYINKLLGQSDTYTKNLFVNKKDESAWDLSEHIPKLIDRVIKENIMKDFNNYITRIEFYDS